MRQSGRRLPDLPIRFPFDGGEPTYAFPARRVLAAEAGDGGQGLRSNRAAAPQAALRVVAGLGTLSVIGAPFMRGHSHRAMPYDDRGRLLENPHVVERAQSSASYCITRHPCFPHAQARSNGLPGRPRTPAVRAAAIGS